jgi:hypothetical protein
LRGSVDHVQRINQDANEQRYASATPVPYSLISKLQPPKCHTSSEVILVFQSVPPVIIHPPARGSVRRPFTLIMRYLALFAALPALSYADVWYAVEWDAPKFTHFSGEFVIPKNAHITLPNNLKGTPYVWPGLQSSKGVLQAVCDGR